MNGRKISKIDVFDRIEGILEAFVDIGRLSPEELTRGQKLDPLEDDNFVEVSGRIFHQSVNKIRDNDIERLNKGLPSKGLKTLSVYNVKDYNQMSCYLGKNNSSGYCIAHGDELVSVFSSQKASADALMIDAIKNGARRLDCYASRSKKGSISGPLYGLYSKYGFKIDKSMNEGVPGQPYAVVRGVSDYVDDNGVVHPDNPTVVVFMKK